jgi:integrase
VKAAFNLAFRAGRVTDDRAWRRVGAFKGAGEARKIILTDAQLQRLVDACATDLREFSLAGAWTGARLGELTSARVRDFDAREATLALRGKTGGRTIHLPAAAVTLLRGLASGQPPDAYLFQRSTGALDPELA